MAEPVDITATRGTIEYYQQLRDLHLSAIEDGTHAVEYRIGTRWVTKRKLSELTDMVAWCDRQLAQLQNAAGGRRGRVRTIIVRDR